MACSIIGLYKTFIMLILFSFFLFYLANSIEFLVGGDDGWGIPKKDEEFYNQWASQNRFKVNDTVRFKYKKDSVMVVSEQEYKKCRSGRPLFYSNNGDTIIELDRPGLFYFISGVTGHCERGEKMIIKVLEQPETPPQAGNDTTPTNQKNGVVSTHITFIASTLVVLLVSFFFFGNFFI